MLTSTLRHLGFLWRRYRILPKRRYYTKAVKKVLGLDIWSSSWLTEDVRDGGSGLGEESSMFLDGRK